MLIVETDFWLCTKNVQLPLAIIYRLSCDVVQLIIDIFATRDWCVSSCTGSEQCRWVAKRSSSLRCVVDPAAAYAFTIFNMMRRSIHKLAKQIK